MTEVTTEKRKVRIGTLLVGSTFLIPGLAISGWSMYGYMRTSAHAPIWLCLGASAAFDGIGLFAAFKAHDFAAAGRKARFAWFVVYAAVVASVFINWRHASAQDWALGIHVLISAPAAAAAAAFELIMQETREIERSKHEKRIRTRQSAKVDLDIYFHHPLMVWSARRSESADRLRAALAGQAAGHGGRTEAPAGQPDTAAGAGQERTADSRTATGAAADRADDWAAFEADLSERTARPDTAAGRAAPAASGALAAADGPVPGQRSGPARHSRTSEPDSADNGAELAEATSINAGPSKVTDVVRRVYRPEWDTATIARIVTTEVPDAKPDTISRAVRRVRNERTADGGPDGRATGTGQYL